MQLCKQRWIMPSSWLVPMLVSVSAAGSYWSSVSTAHAECQGSSGISSNFNGTAIPAGRYIWFNSVLKYSGPTSAPVTVVFENSSIQFSANGTPYTVAVPKAIITFSPSAMVATTTFDAGQNAWITTTPFGTSGNVFLSGVSFPVPVNFPGGISPVLWAGDFSSNPSGVSLNWKWGAAVYSTFSTNHAALGVKPVDDNSASAYQNSHHAGAPENFLSYVVGGARGGGGSNYTGSYSGTAGTCTLVGVEQYPWSALKEMYR